jgi:translocation and assembly module TamB
VRLDGAGVLRGRVTGSLPAWQLQLAAGLSAVDAFGVRVRAARVQGQLAWDSAGLRLDLSGAADTLAVGDLVYGPVGAAAQGVPDSMSLRLSAGLGRASGVAAALGIWGDSARRFVRVDSLALDLAVGRWRLVRPAVLVVDREAVSVDTVDLRPVRGGGRFLAEGSLPRGGVGDFVLRAESLPVVDLLALAGHDTTATGGALDLVLRVAGPAATPSMEGSIALREGRSGDFRAPLAEMLVRYVDRRLTLKGGLWRDTVRVIALSGSLPLDLALEPVPARRLPGALQVAARSDSVDLAVLDPLIDVVSGLTGTLTADAGVSGTWERPTLAGHLEVHRGTVTVPALGARYTGLDARLDLDDAGITVTRARAQAGGAITIGGRVRTAGERATLDLTVRADNFAAFDVPDLGSLTATGDLTLRGPVLGATLAGSLRVDRGTLRFADLVEKEIVSLDDPEFRAIVDSNLAAAAALGPEFRTVFVDSLRIDGLTLTMGPDVWLRSSEASIQLDGEFRVDKQVEMGLPRYRFDGTLRANRGVYRLVLGPVNSPLQVSKDFRVTRGTVRFFGMPDFDPAMDIVAEHQLRTAAGSPMLVRALISGTLRSPQLRLESDERPPLNETEIVSYMLFGRPPSDLTQSQAGGGEMAVLQSTVGGVAGGFGQALLSDLGLPLDYLTLQTGSRRSSDALGLSSARIGAGLQLGDRTFLTLTAGVCEVMTSQLIGAGVEYRLASRWTATAAFEPLVRECGVASSLSGLSARYQLSFDVLWRQGTR